MDKDDLVNPSILVRVSRFQLLFQGWRSDAIASAIRRTQELAVKLQPGMVDFDALLILIVLVLFLVLESPIRAMRSVPLGLDTLKRELQLAGRGSRLEFNLQVVL